MSDRAEILAPVVPVVFPELSTEQKLAVRESQFQLVALREQADLAIKKAEQNLIDTVRKIATDLKIPEGVNFNFGPLSFSPKP
jgi:hypothetical protein